MENMTAHTSSAYAAERYDHCNTRIAVASIRMSNPAPNLTGRSSDQFVRSANTTGKPASRHARVPPCNTAIVPLRCSRSSRAIEARVPPSQTRTIAPSPKSAWRNGSCCSGMHFAPGICPATNSVSERTSTISGLWPERHNCESSCTLMVVGVKKFFLSYRKSPAGNKRIQGRVAISLLNCTLMGGHHVLPQTSTGLKGRSGQPALDNFRSSG